MNIEDIAKNPEDAKVSKDIAHYREAVRLQPDLLGAQFNLATALLGEGNATEAIEHYQQAVKLKPDLAAAHYKLAVAWTRLGNYDNATNYCDHVVKLSAELAPALADCAWLLATHEGAAPSDVQRAIEIATRACRLTGENDPACLDALAAAYAANGQFSNAVTTAEKALASARKSGPAALAQAFPDGAITNNVIVGALASYYPAGELFPKTWDQALALYPWAGARNVTSRGSNA